MATFADRLKELRNESGLKQEELGDAIGVEANTVSRWETGRNPASEENRLLLAHYFNVPYAYMMGITDDRIEPCLTDEEVERLKAEAQQDEDQMLMLYRKLSPGMQKMIRTMVNQAYLIERERQ